MGHREIDKTTVYSGRPEEEPSRQMPADAEPQPTGTDGSNGWGTSAEAWIEEQGEAGDYSRRHVLDGPMIARIDKHIFRTALDIGCGEGRFCRIMKARGIQTVGIDPTDALIRCARERDPGGDYRLARAETLDVPPGTFDLVVCYLSLIDISDLRMAFERIITAMRAGGILLIANLNGFSTAGMPPGWTANPDGTMRFSIDNYLEERAIWLSWRGIRIQNWHRPLSAYMTPLLAQGLRLRYFSEPAPDGGDPATAERYRRVPYFHVMEWAKPNP